MEGAPRLTRLERRVQRSKRAGKLIMLGVLLVSVVFGAVLLQGLLLAHDVGRTDLLARAMAGLLLLVGLDLFSVIMIRRQHQMLDEARADLRELVGGDPFL
jgi:hypothetical protein